MDLEQTLPPYPIFEDTRNQQNLNQETASPSIKLNMNASSSQSFSVYHLELVLGTTCAFLILFIVALSILILLQRKEIIRLRAFFHGQHPVEEMKSIITNDHVADMFENQNIVHQNRNINNLVDLIFPKVVPGFKNVTSIREFHKNQCAALKIYHGEQMGIFKNNSDN